MVFGFSYKKIIGWLVFLIVVVGLIFIFVSKGRVIGAQDFEKMVSGKFEKVSEVANLFPNSASDVKKRVELIAQMVKGELASILSVKEDERNFENTAQALDNIKAKFTVALNGIELMGYIHPAESVRKACQEASGKLKGLEVSAFFNKDLYQAFTSYRENAFKREKLSDEKKYFVQETISGYERKGFNLSDKQFEQVKDLTKQVSQLALQFNQNITEDKSVVQFTREELEGVVPQFLASLKKGGEGKYIVPLDGPHGEQVFSRAIKSETRKKYYFANFNRAYPKNIEVLNALVAKRDELAKKLNFESFANMDLSSKMAKTPDRVRTFLQDLLDKLVEKEDEEFKEQTKELPEGVQLDENGMIAQWDFLYVNAKYKEKNYSVDEHKISEYFPVGSTVEKIFDIYQKFFDLQFKPINVAGLWHDDVTAMQVYDNTTQEKLGVVLIDIYARTNKFPQTFMLDVVRSTTKVPLVAVVSAGFAKGTVDQPSLFMHRNLISFFHEFGHVIHSLMGRTQLSTFSGNNVKRDFNEMPSQMLEGWMWDRDMLKSVSSHFKTGEQLPDELLDKKIELKNMMSGYQNAGMSVKALLSLEYFGKGAKKDLKGIKKKLYEKYIRNVRYEDAAHSQASFTHLASYGASFYSYMWSKVYAVDIFEKIRKKGLLNPEIGEEYADKVLRPGGSIDPDILLKDFLGRRPNQDAFLKYIGI